MSYPNGPDHHTIIAEATPPGRGGVSIVRLSGPKAWSIANKLCKVHGIAHLDLSEPRRFHNADICSVDSVIDSGLVVAFKGPKSLTGEDVVELHLHGNPAIVRQVVESGVEAGARMAVAGEFMRRAFIGGKVDLTQVDALASLLVAEEEALLSASNHQLGGALRTKLESLRDSLLSLVARLELGLDFAEEGYEFTDREEAERLLGEVVSLVRSLLRAHESLLVAAHVPKVLLLGRPNAGKSTLFNAILGYDRSITHHLAGTTRDYVGEHVVVRGRTIEFLDTAGLRSEGDEIESIGVERARQLVRSADLILWMIDVSDRDASVASIEEARTLLDQDSPVLLVNSRADLSSTPLLDSSDFPIAVLDSLSVSVTDPLSVSGLIEAIASSLDSDAAISSRNLEYIVTDRQASILKRILALLNEAFPAFESNDTSAVLLEDDFDTLLLSSDLRQLLPLLDDLIGFSTNEQVLDRIFGQFCIGK